MLASASTAEQFPAHFGLSLYYGHRGDFERSMRLVGRLTELASEGDDSMKLQALHGRWMNSLFSGRLDDAVAAADDARAIYRAEAHHQLSFLYGNHDPGVCALALQALAFALQGESNTAVIQMREAIALGETLGHAATLAQPLTQLPWVLQINGDAEAALSAAERALAFEAEVVQPQFFGIAHAMRGWALARMGRYEEGVAELERALADELRSSDIWAAMVGGLLAEVHVSQGHPAASTARPRRCEGDHAGDPVVRLRAGAPPDRGRVAARGRSRGRRPPAPASSGRNGPRPDVVGPGSPLGACARTAAADARAADLELLAELCERLPADNATDYRREAGALLTCPPTVSSVP